MFNKPTFGAASTSGFGFNNAATPSPFGQSTFGKPATTSFGQTAAFGQPSSSLFGGNQPSGGLFGSANPSPFGAPQATTQSGFGGFAQPTNTSVFGNAGTNQNTSIFGQSGTSAFGAAKPSGFGFGSSQPTASIFGQASTSTATGAGFFGQQNAAGSSIFGATPTPAFGATVTGNSGTAIAKYQPSLGQDTLMKNGQANSVSTKQHCITTMKEYEAKSLEELRMEDYLANRKGPQAGAVGGIFGTGTTSTGMFGAPAQQQTTGLFGQQPDNKGLFSNTNPMTGFGQTNAFGATTSQPSAGGMFNKPFAAPTTSTSSFGFGNTTNNTTSNLFGAKPFGSPATGSVFGAPPANTGAPSAFGQPNTGFGGFGQTNTNQNNTLFGASQDKPAFGMAATSSGFGFGTNTNTMAGGSLFQPKPNTGFGAPTGGFGTSTSMTSGFGGFGQTNTGGSLFNSSFNKPATSGFGTFGNPTSSAPLGGLGTNTGGLFGGATNKPGGFFGSNTGTGTGGGLFNNSLSFGNNNSLMGGLGQSSLGIGGAPALGQNQQNTVPVHQQILALTTSPYGDNPIFKDLKPPVGITEDSLKPTNPAAQKAILESSSSQFRVSSAKIDRGVKVKPIGNGLSKKSLFEGLEEYDSSVEENFNLKPNARRLIISKGGVTPSKSLNDSVTQSPQGSLFGAADKRRVSLNVTPVVHQDKENQESFRNEIPTTIPKALDNPRRVSWLHSNLDKNRARNSDVYLESTIQEIVAEKKKSESAKTSGVSSGSRMSGQTLSQDKDVSSTSREVSEASVAADMSDGEEMLDQMTANAEPHPTGIVLRRAGYYTIPSLEQLMDYLKEDGTCVVKNFTIGRERYGNVFYDEEMDVAGLNLDENVFFRHKEIVIYPLDDQKPPIGVGLNRPAQVTLDQVWPHDKQTHESIKDPERLQSQGYEDFLRRVCKKHDTRFVEYRPETGSWVFKVDHFSKYGLTESDEEGAGPVDPAKKPKISAPPAQKTPLSVEKSKQLPEVPFSSTALSHPDIDELRQMTSIERSFEMEDDFDMDFVPSFSQTHPVSPSASVAMEMGAKSHKLQLMKAAFFADDDYDNRSVCTDSMTGRESPDQDQIVPSRHLGSRFSSMQSMYKGSSVMSLQTQSEDTPTVSYTPVRVAPVTSKADVVEKRIPRQIIEPMYYPLVVEPKIAIVNPVGTIIPCESSIVRRLRAKCVADSGILAGRRFKVGWGPRNAVMILSSKHAVQDLVRATTSLGDFAPLLAARNVNDKSPAIAVRLEVASVLPIRAFHRSIHKHLGIQLKYCEKVIFSPSECPQFLPAGGTDLLSEHCQLAREQQKMGDQEKKYGQTVWSLCEALWGEEEELQGQDPASHLTVMRRRELLSNWLEEVVTEKSSGSAEKSDYLEYLLQLLYAHKVTEACELAFMKSDMNLSLLISQSSGGPIVRQLIQHQLASWQEVEADKFINANRLKVFMLIAGIPLLSSSNESLNEGKGGTINVFQDVDWITALALNLWYLCSPTASITDALLNYESAFTSEDGVAAAPRPPYTDYEVNSASPIQDMRYHLLKLYSKRSHRIETLLNPATHTADSMDFRLSWLLLQTLDTLGYHHCSEKSECQLHTSFASQLENYGMWHWAIFVLLHIRNRERREMSVQQMLYRFIMLPGEGDAEYEANERFVVEQLHIPVTWICWAKAVRAGAMRKHQEQAEFLIKAKQWNLAHEVIMEHIAPDAVINDNIPYLMQLLRALKETKKIMNWRNQGQILYDFIDMNEKFESFKSVAESELVSHWEGLKPQLDELCSRINLFPCPTAKHRLCQSEISQRLACLVRGVLMTSPHLNPCLLIKVALEKLPLPQEYAQKELRFFIDSVMVDTFQPTDDQMDV
ncbi:nuclear pore complex protein Nup98-Nup96 [Phlebotomus argentipes]|uniref:nuclear pore complex protein Nup98-Nup96 n=1 Tax=Phlebotomus argentipes TaxID=94469 RepID=UPI002892DC35|nr:nuclear pore complex protein Nup98-Nup96 [Phlebotomus argentipes]